MTRNRKKHIYEACVLPKLLYSLETLWFTKAERSRIDGFHVRCLRQIYGIAHSFVSRVSNKSVLATASALPLSNLLLQRQLHLFRKIACMSDDNPVRGSVLQPGSIDLQEHSAKRRVGRPRLAWANCVRQHAQRAAGSESELKRMTLQARDDQEEWRQTVARYIKEPSCFHR